MTKAQKRKAAREYQRAWYAKNKRKKAGNIQAIPKKVFEPADSDPKQADLQTFGSGEGKTQAVRFVGDYNLNYCPHCGVHLEKIELY